MSTRHQHKFQRLSDEAIFCACGEVKHVSEPVCTRPHYPGWHVYPYWPQPYVYPTIYWGTTTTGDSISIGGTTTSVLDDNTTYTLT